MKKLFLLVFLFTQLIFAQSPEEQALASIRNEGFQNSKATEMLHELTDIYGSRLTGSREYKKAAEWMSATMEQIGLQKVHFERYCPQCRGWSINSFNMELVSPNYMQLTAYPLAMSKSTPGSVRGEVIHIKDRRDVEGMKKEYAGKLKDKVILYGAVPKAKDLTEPILKRHTAESLDKLESKLVPETRTTPLPDLLKSWEVSDKADVEFLEFFEQEGARAVVVTHSAQPGMLYAQGTYHALENDFKPMPYFSMIPEHFGRLARMLDEEVTPQVRLELDSEFYLEPENNVNIVGEISGSDPKLKDEVVLVGGHFDSWHSATGATDNGVSCITLVEALRILKSTGFQPKRTVRIALWGGEEQAFYGSVAYAEQHFGVLGETPNTESKKVSAYLNLDNGAGAIRGVYLQGNELARPVFEALFDDLESLGTTEPTIENTLSTDHEVFDYYNIPAFQFVQDELTYRSLTHHTQLDFPEYVPEDDLKKNAVILAWVIRNLADRPGMVPRKK